MKLTTIYLIFLTIFLSGCATPHVMDKKKVTDSKLNCEQLLSGIKEAETFEKQARKEKGVTGTNAAAAVFFWPALFFTYANVEEAIEAAQERQEHLEEAYLKKECE